MKKLWDLKKGFSNLELEGQGQGIIMGVTHLLLLGPFYTIHTKTDKTFWRAVYKVKTWLDQIFWQIYQKLMLSGFLTQESWVVSLITFIRSLATVQSDCSSQFSNFKHTIAWYHFKKRSPFFALFKKKVFTCIFWTCKWHDTVVTLSAGDDKRPAEA